MKTLQNLVKHVKMLEQMIQDDEEAGENVTLLKLELHDLLETIGDEWDWDNDES